jgi:hypothetical protein
VRDDEVAKQIDNAMGKRVVLHYEEKVGLPTSCFGDTRYFVTSVRVQDDFSLAPGVTVPQATGVPASGVTAPAAPAAPAASGAGY